MSVSVSVRVASSPKDTCHRGPGPLPGPRSPVITPLKARLCMQSRSQVSGVELGQADFGARHLAPNGVLPPRERLLSYFLGSSSPCFLGFLSRISVLSRLALRDRPPCLLPRPPSPPSPGFCPSPVSSIAGGRWGSPWKRTSYPTFVPPSAKCPPKFRAWHNRPVSLKSKVR